MHALVAAPSLPSVSFAQCAQWPQGPLHCLLMQVTADPLGVLTGAPDCRALASTRCVLRSGIVYGVALQGPRDVLAPSCRLLAEVLPQHGYDESAFPNLDRQIAHVLRAAGYGAVRASLERNATIHARPVMAATQVGKLVRAVAGRPLPWRDHTGAAEQGADPAVAAYAALLDPHARAHAADAQTVCGQAPDRLAVYNFIVGGARTSAYRAQALRALPWLMPVLSAPEGGRILREMAAIRAAIDSAEPLHDAVARACAVPREVVRWLSTRELPGHWRLDELRLRRLLAALSWLPPETRPQSPAQFVDFVNLCSMLAQVFKFRDDRGDLRISAWSVLHGPCMRRWLAECRQPGWAREAMRGNPQDFAARCADASDFLGTLVDAVQHRRDTRDEAALAHVMRWAAGIGLRRLLALSRQWHAGAFTVAGAAWEEPDLTAWPAILQQVMCFDGVSVIELTSVAQLREESARMQHCVATYGPACYGGHSAIVSLRTASGVVLSTAELRLVENDVLRVVVAQHRSARNGVADAACERALAALVRCLNEGAAEPLLRARIRFQQRHRGQAPLRQQLRDEQAWQLALQLAAGILDVA